MSPENGPLPPGKASVVGPRAVAGFKGCRRGPYKGPLPRSNYPKTLEASSLILHAQVHQDRQLPPPHAKAPRCLEFRDSGGSGV